MPLAAESRLGPYLVQSLLGSGSMGEVYRARDARLHRDVAIKIFRFGDQLEGSRERFAQEARAASSLSHPNIVTIHDVGEEAGISYIVAELVEGETLRDILKTSGPLPLRKALDISIQIVEGLAAAHESGIIHRDLKPENVMLTRDGRVKIVDFGLAKAPDVGSADMDRLANDGLTAPGLVIGTAPYMSPEQAKGARLNFWSDQFAVGAILYEMVAGQPAFRRETGLQTLSAILTEDPEPLTRGSGALQWIIRRCLHKEPDHRYASTADLLRDLRSAGAHLTDVLPEQEGPDDAQSLTAQIARVDPVTTGRAWLQPVLSILLLLAAAAIGFGIAYFFLPRAHVFQASRYSPFTSGTGLQVSPFWSPNGRTLAYSAESSNIFQIFVRSVGNTESTQLTRLPNDCFSVAWSGDGSRLYFQSGAALWSISATGGSPEKVSTDVAAAAVSPKGDALAVLRPSSEGRVALWQGSVTRRDLKRSTVVAWEMLPQSYLRFSPDGKTVGLWAAVPAGESQFWLVAADGTEAHRALTGIESRSLARPFSWFSDSRHIVFDDRQTLTGNAHLVEASTATGRSAPFTSGTGSERSPSANPDDQSVAFENANLDYNIVQVSLDRATITDEISTSLLEACPAQSLDGSVAYVAERNGQPEIWIRSGPEQKERPLVVAESFGTDRTYAFGDLAFSPDGKRIAYRRTGQKGDAVWISNLNGDPPVPLKSDSAVAFQGNPFWSPDGNTILFTGTEGAHKSLWQVRPGAPGAPTKIADFSGEGLACSSDGRTCASRLPGGGVETISVDGGESTRIGQLHWLTLGFENKRAEIVGIVRTPNSRIALATISLTDRTEHLLGSLGPYSATYRYGKTLGADPFVGFSISPDGRSFLTSVLHARSNIWLVERKR